MSGGEVPTPNNHDTQPPPSSSNFSISQTEIQDAISAIQIKFQQGRIHQGNDQRPSSPNHVMHESSSTNSDINLLVNDATFQGIVQSIASDIRLPEAILMNEESLRDFLCSILNTQSSLQDTANEENGKQDPNSTYCPVTSFLVTTSKLMKDKITKLLKDETTLLLKDKITMLIKDIITKLMKDHIPKLTDEFEKFMKETMLASSADNSTSKPNHILLEKVIMAVLDSIISVIKSSID
ncbi:unnamed protein product [Lactuca saligna]|uniref:Uncharacterized protein n=1 Tax=Lactuca saligna TaxID=75948 RepID=A0AA35YN95_LACSI|nr:unnamed protein product [Lactuca saligna]